MIIGLDTFQDDVFQRNICHSNYNIIEVYEMLLDHIYMDETVDFGMSPVQPGNWKYDTALNAHFKETLEAGSVEAEEMQIEKIIFYRRGWDDVEWQEIAEVEYEGDEKMLYEAIDRYVANHELYEYSVVPVTSNIEGQRVVSESVRAQFDGVFISDKESSYQMIYNLELSEITNNLSNAVLTPQNAKYPIVTSSNLDYSEFGVQALFLSTETVENNSGEIDIRMERLGREKLLNFLKDGKPKVYRDMDGNMKLVMVVGDPVEIPHSSKRGLATLSVDFVEVGGMDAETLMANDMQERLEEDY